MKRRKPAPPNPLSLGQYRVRCREESFMEAAANGHGAVYPEAVAICDGKWCVFYKEGLEVWSCNAIYATAQFDVQSLVDEARHE